MSDPASASLVWLLVAFPFLWIFALQMLATIGGWRALSEAYPGAGGFAGAKKSMQFASFHQVRLMPTNYSNMLTIGADARGVYFDVLFLFRPGHAPFLIPYEELRGEERRFLMFPYIALRTERVPDVSVNIGKGNACWLERESGGKWTFARIAGSV